MKKIIPLLLAGIWFAACDDGNIYPKEKEDVSGATATIQVRFSGQDAWPDAYKLVFAGFDENTEVPSISKVISKPASDTATQTVTLNGLTDDIKTLSISLLGKGRNLIYNFYSYPVPKGSDHILLPVEEINLAELPRVQAQIFDLHCTRCHGAGNHAAADLDLTAGHSQADLLNIPTVTGPTGTFRIVPGNVEKSFLHQVLTEDCIEGYNHTDVLPEEELLSLIETWIKNCK